MTFTTESIPCHVFARICRWTGNIEEAVEPLARRFPDLYRSLKEECKTLTARTAQSRGPGDEVLSQILWLIGRIAARVETLAQTGLIDSTASQDAKERAAELREVLRSSPQNVTELEETGKLRTVFLVEDHAAVRQGVSALIDSEEGLRVQGTAANAEEALEKITALKPDVAIVDLSLAGTSGLELIQKLSTDYPDMPVLVLSAHDEVRFAERSLRAGARGYVMKSQEAGQLIQAIHEVLEGGISLSRALKERLFARMAGHPPPGPPEPQDVLTGRELEIFELIGQGLSTAETSESLHIGRKTVRNHQENIRKKLDLPSSILLHQAAYAWVHIDGPI